MFDPKKLKLRHLAFSFLVSYPNRKVEWTPQCLSSREQSIPQRFSTLFTPLVLFTPLPNLLCLILKSKAAILLLLLSALFFPFLFFSFLVFSLPPALYRFFPATNQTIRIRYNQDFAISNDQVLYSSRFRQGENNHIAWDFNFVESHWPSGLANIIIREFERKKRNTFGFWSIY